MSENVAKTIGKRTLVFPETNHGDPNVLLVAKGGDGQNEVTASSPNLPIYPKWPTTLNNLQPLSASGFHRKSNSGVASSKSSESINVGGGFRQTPSNESNRWSVCDDASSYTSSSSVESPTRVYWDQNGVVLYETAKFSCCAAADSMPELAVLRQHLAKQDNNGKVHAVLSCLNLSMFNSS